MINWVEVDKAARKDYQRQQIAKAFNDTIRTTKARTITEVQRQELSQVTQRQAQQEQEQMQQADRGNKVLSAVLQAMRDVERKHMVKPDKIVLTVPQYTEVVQLAGNMYSGYWPLLMDANFPSKKGSLFGIDLEVGPKAKVMVNPMFQTYAVSGENGLGIEARQVETRQEITIPLYFQEFFRNYIIRRKTRGELIEHVSENELTAIETLREMISETEYRRYIKYGFISVTAKSGATYQVFRNHSHTKVWKGGKLVEEVCVRIREQVPPTDNVIAFKIMIETDEEEFKKLGNVYRRLAA